MVKHCIVCRKELEGKGLRKYCSAECRLEAKRDRDRVYMREKRFRGEVRKDKILKPTHSSFEDNVREAKKRGLSYGTYMAIKEGRC